MFDYIYLGSSPANEPCAQTTDPDYHDKARAECRRYKALLEATYAAAHRGNPCPARIQVKSNSHDFGTYFKVVATYQVGNEKEMRAAFWLEENAPENWPDCGCIRGTAECKNHP